MAGWARNLSSKARLKLRDPTRFFGEQQRKKKGYWNDKENQSRCIDEVGQQLRIFVLSDWYKANTRDIQTKGGQQLLKKYDNSYSTALVALYPDYSWNPSKFDTVPTYYWDDIAKQRAKFDQVARDNGVKLFSDWNRFSWEDLCHRGCTTILQKYKNSISEALDTLYPKSDWAQYELAVAQHKHEALRAQREIKLDSVGYQHGIKVLDDWYKISVLASVAHLKKCFDGNLVSALRHVYPDHTWEEWRFNCPSGSVVNDYMARLEKIAQSLGVKYLDDWINVSKSEMIRSGGHFIMKKYGGSLSRLLSVLYPDYEWNFDQKAPLNYWTETANVAVWMRGAEQELGVKQPSDWYRVSRKQLEDLNGRGLSHYFPTVLKQIYPEYEWDDALLDNADRRSIQRMVVLNIKDLFAIS